MKTEKLTARENHCDRFQDSRQQTRECECLTETRYTNVRFMSCFKGSGPIFLCFTFTRENTSRVTNGSSLE